jgi:hypothetical protein
MECAEGKISEKESRGLLVSCARATRGLRRPSLDARIGRPNRPPLERRRTKLERMKMEEKDGMDDPFARRVRTIRMCSLDARGEGPIQATLLRNGGVWRERWEERAAMRLLLARRTRTVKRCSFDARNEGQPGYALWGQEVGRDIRRADSRMDNGLAVYPGACR